MLFIRCAAPTVKSIRRFRFCSGSLWLRGCQVLSWCHGVWAADAAVNSKQTVL